MKKQNKFTNEFPEKTKQIQGREEGRQVPDAKINLCHNLGGAFSMASITFLG